MEINFDDDCVAADELQMLKSKYAILEKLRMVFGANQVRLEPVQNGENLGILAVRGQS